MAGSKKVISFEIPFYDVIITEIFDAKTGKVWSVKN